MSKYIWRDGYRPGVDATVAGNELDRIHRERGRLTPGEVVDEARPEEAALHPAFEWCDQTAADRYREWQARSMIRAIQIVTDDQEDPAPAYYHIRYDDGASYKSAETVAQDVDLYARARGELLGKLAGAERSVRQLESLARASGDTKRIREARRMSKAVGSAVEKLRATH